MQPLRNIFNIVHGCFYPKKDILMQKNYRLNKLFALWMVIMLFGMQGCQGETGSSSSTIHSYIQSIAAWAASLFKRKQEHTLQKLENKHNIVPLVVIGSGPAGLGAGLYGARDNTYTLVIDGPNPGGLLMYTTDVENWPGRKTITGPEIIKELRESAQLRGAKFLTDTVESIDLSHWPFVIKTTNGIEINALAVIAATGASPRKLNVPGEEKYWGYGVTSCAVCDAQFFKDEDVVVVGGGDSAIEEAMQLSNHVRSITILVRGDAFRAAASMQARIANNPKVTVIYNVEVKKIVGTDGDNKEVNGVEIFNNKTKTTSMMKTSGVFLAIGHIPNSHLFKGQLDINDYGYVITKDCTHKTSVPGVFAAGEIEDFRYKQAWSSGGRGTEAALDALAWLRSIGFDGHALQVLQERGALWVPGEAGKSYEVAALNSVAHFTEQSKKSKKPMILDFWSKDCPGCMSMMPTFTAIAAKYKDAVNFYKVNTQGETGAGNDLVTKFHINRIPTVLAFKNGKVVARYTKVMTFKELDELVTSLLQETVAQPKAAPAA